MPKLSYSQKEVMFITGQSRGIVSRKIKDGIYKVEYGMITAKSLVEDGITDEMFAILDDKTTVTTPSPVVPVESAPQVNKEPSEPSELDKIKRQILLEQASLDLDQIKAKRGSLISIDKFAELESRITKLEQERIAKLEQAIYDLQSQKPSCEASETYDDEPEPEPVNTKLIVIEKPLIERTSHIIMVYKPKKDIFNKDIRWTEYTKNRQELLSRIGFNSMDEINYLFDFTCERVNMTEDREQIAYRVQTEYEDWKAHERDNSKFVENNPDVINRYMRSKGMR